MIFTDALEIFASEMIKVGKEEAGTRDLNQEYRKFQANQDKAQTRQLLELARRKVHGQINHWHITMIIFTAIQNNPSKVWTYSFVAVNLNPHHNLSLYVCIKKIVTAVKTGETAYFRNHESSYYDAMTYVCKNMTVIKIIELMYIIGLFTVETPHGMSL